MKLIVEGRQSCGLSQQEVADRCGMKQSNISRLENGNGNPTISTLQKLAHCFGKKLEIRFV
ncbi:MAG: helix-turn-helix transcriptional regulator [Adlercreutzia equolifaciens]|nr:helix-turn-helix transcriptional regulator [Adlercreutzia equolifaciens]